MRLTGTSDISSILRASSETPQPAGIVECSKDKEEIANTLEASTTDKSETKETLVASPPNEPLPVPPPVRDALLQRMSVDKVHGPLLNAMNITSPIAQIFPPGAEFIKAWQVTNNGLIEWPETTELVFMGGDAVTSDLNPILIGKVEAGAKVEISTRELKVGRIYYSRRE